MYAWIFACINVCMFVRLFEIRCFYVGRYGCLYVFLYRFVVMRVCMFFMYACVHAFMCVYTHVCMYVCIVFSCMIIIPV